MSYGGGHAPDLAVASFGEREFDPCGRDVFAEANRRRARRQIGLRVEQAHLRGTRAIALNRHSGGELFKRLGARNAFDLREIGALVSITWVREAMLKVAVIGEQEQSFAILIETAYRIDAGNRYELFQRGCCVAGFIRELAEYSVGLVEEDVAQSTV